MFQQAFWLVKKDLKSQWAAIALTVVATIVIALATSIFLEQSIRHMFGGDEPYDRYAVLDMFFLLITPSFGAIFMSRPYLTFQTIKEDPFSKRMALFRSLPIPIKTLSLSRILLMLVILFMLSLTFYVTITIALPSEFFVHVTAIEYMVFILFWFGYSLAIAGLNPFIEFGTNGKILHLVPWVFVIAFFVMMFTYYNQVEQGIVQTVLILIKSHGWPLALISILVGVGASFIWYKALINRLRRKDYL